jgi:hypothetical protein
MNMNANSENFALAESALPTAGEPPAKLVVDAEHLGVRFLMTALAIGGLVVGAVIGQILAPMIDEALNSLCLVIPLAIVALVVFTQLGERVIKPRWSSGRSILLDSGHITLEDKRRGKKTTFEWMYPVEFHTWYFPVAQRRTRVQRGWYCTALRLQQNEQQIIVYTFLDPAKTNQVPHFKDHFIQLRKRKELESIKTLDARLAAQLTRLYKMEKERERYGGELSNHDFSLVWQAVERYGKQGVAE